MAMQSIDTDAQDRPLFPPVIRRTKIILNPFDDMMADKPEEALNKKEETVIDSVAIKKEEIKKLKKRNKLTFDFDEVTDGNKIKSSHEVLKDSKLSN